jgi:SAM-dependent methyltransferase
MAGLFTRSDDWTFVKLSFAKLIIVSLVVGVVASRRYRFQRAFYESLDTLEVDEDWVNFRDLTSIDIQSLGPAPRIADVATGTGFGSEFFFPRRIALTSCRIWLLESRSLFPPESRLDGFDIDLAQAPHAKWLPDNLYLRQWDMLGDVPDDMVGIYDIVHVRLVMLVIKDNDPVPLIKNLCKLLSDVIQLGSYLTLR